MQQRWVIGLGISILAVGLLFWLIWPRAARAPVMSSLQSAITVEPMPVANNSVAPAVATGRYLRAANIPAVDSAFTFGATIPSDWDAAAIIGSAAIALYDNAAQGDTTLDQAQIFIRSFTANDFLTLPSVDILARQELEVAGRSAVRYDIAKKESVAPFSAQPAWRNQRHIVTDVRVADTNPSIFYVIAKRPSLDEAIYQDFLASFAIKAREDTTTEQAADLLPPVAQFQERITKKPFGIFITPASSPVQPERFSGYHTGVDVEYSDVSTDVPVRAIADGTVLLAEVIDGYGGVMAVQHVIVGEKVVGIYGHLRLGFLPRVGSHIKAGEQLSVLGAGETAETDGERKHLHFGLLAGTTVDLRGYVEQVDDLARWVDPLTIVPANDIIRP